MRLVARCPAKVNLALRVLGKRPDGYHELETVFQAVDLWDRLDVELADDFEMTCDHPGIPLDDSNLVLRAARRFREATGGERGANRSTRSPPGSDPMSRSSSPGGRRSAGDAGSVSSAWRASRRRRCCSGFLRSEFPPRRSTAVCVSRGPQAAKRFG
jgi:hypothetical protein